MRKIAAFFIFITFAIASYSQENNITQFGLNAGLNTGSGTSDYHPGGIVRTLEGCAKVSDNKGGLIFYTDGGSVYNHKHIVMPNGSGLMGKNSAGQSGLVIKKPGSGNIYYIFTVNRKDGIGLRFTIVDMNRENGLGDVIVKNKPILASAAEKVTAVKHAENDEFWIIAHGWNDNSFYSYILSEGGLNLVPVVSNAGTVHSGAVDNKIGYMTASFNGKKLSSSIYGKGVVDILDFDNYSGKVSSGFSIESDKYSTSINCEFSPDASKLYVSELVAPAKVYQYDLSKENSKEIRKSKTLIYSSDSGDFYARLQYGTDNKIYVTNFTSNFLGVINNPNLQAENCSFEDISDELETDLPHFSVPRFVKYFIPADVVPSGNQGNIKLNIIPQPGSDEMAVNLQSKEKGNFRLEIFSLDGRTMDAYEWHDKRDNQNLNLRFDTRDYPSGLYYLILKTDTQRISRSITIMK